jgi:hypothetical protein
MSSKSEVQGSELSSSGIDRISRDEGRLMVERRMYKSAAIERLTDDEFYVLNGESGREELPRKGLPNEPYTRILRGKWDNDDIQAEQRRALARWTKLVAQRREANYWLIDRGFTGEVIDRVDLECRLDECFPANPFRRVVEEPEHPKEELIQPPVWIIPAHDAPRSQVAVWAVRRLMRLHEDWAAGIPRRLKDGKLKSVSKLTDEINILLRSPEKSKFIGIEERQKLRGGVSETTVKRALDLKR